MALMRLDKIISQNGRISRRDVKALIKSGAVTCAGLTAKSPDEKYDPETCEIRLNGNLIEYERYHYFMMNKPSGYLSATEDSRAETVLELVPQQYAHLDLFPAGRLDKDSEGLLILTDDGAYCHDVISPGKNVYKKYYIETAREICQSDCKAVAEGIKTRGGADFRPGRLEIITKNTAYMYICEGKFHQVKRMMEALGNKVIYLKRVAIGGLELDGALDLGKMRKMTKSEAELVFGEKAQQLVHDEQSYTK